MPRYIDAEVLKSRLEDFSRWCKDGRKEGVDFVLDCPLPDIPTADVQEVRHGHWIEDKETGSLMCSECGHFTDEIIGDFIPADEETSETLNIPKGTVIHRSMDPLYCSKCGAKMNNEV